MYGIVDMDRCKSEVAELLSELDGEGPSEQELNDIISDLFEQGRVGGWTRNGG